jgi:hypothetical protein
LRTWIKVKSSQNFYGWREPPRKIFALSTLAKFL